MANIPVRDKPCTTLGAYILSGPYNPQASGHEQNAVLSGDYFSNDGRTLLWVRHPGGLQIVLTITIQGSCENRQNHGFAMLIDAGQEGFIGPFDPQRFSEDDGRLTLTSSSTDLLVAAVRF